MRPHLGSVAAFFVLFGPVFLVAHPGFAASEALLLPIGDVVVRLVHNSSAHHVRC